MQIARLLLRVCSLSSEGSVHELGSSVEEERLREMLCLALCLEQNER